MTAGNISLVHSNLAENLWRQRQDGLYVDLTLVFSCGTICVVHKCVIAAMSRYLKSRIDAMEAPDKPLIINDLSFDCVEILLKFMYTGKMTLQDQNHSEVKKAVEKLDLEHSDVIFAFLSAEEQHLRPESPQMEHQYLSQESSQIEHIPLKPESPQPEDQYLKLEVSSDTESCCETDLSLNDDFADNIVKNQPVMNPLDLSQTVSTTSVTHEASMRSGTDFDSVTDVVNVTSNESVDNNPETSCRFATLGSEDLNVLASANTERSTLYQTRWGLKIFRDWLMSRREDLEFEQKSAAELCALLRRFYGEVRSKHGKPYSRSALIGLRAAIQRHLEMPPHNRSVDIIRDSQFKPANVVFTGTLKTNRAEANNVTKLKDAIEPADLQRLYSSGVLSDDNPKALQYKVFFEVSLYFARKRRESLRQLKPSDFEIKHDDQGYEYATICGNGTDTEQEQRMYADPTSLACPVRSLKKYLSKLTPNRDVFFQQACKLKKKVDAGVWYKEKSMNSNDLFGLMSKISKEANLSKVYSNNCIYLTHVALLSSDKVKVDGHEKIQSLFPYNVKIGDKMRRAISKVLSACRNASTETEPNVA